MSASKPYYIYAMDCPTHRNAVRISLSSDPKRAVASYNELGVVPDGEYHLIHAVPVMGARAALLRLHHSLHPQRMTGYWFNMSPEVAAQHLCRLA